MIELKILQRFCFNKNIKRRNKKIKVKIKLAKHFKADVLIRDEICIIRIKHTFPPHTLHTAACIIASNPPSGVSILAEIF